MYISRERPQKWGLDPRSRPVSRLRHYEYLARSLPGLCREDSVASVSSLNRVPKKKKNEFRFLTLVFLIRELEKIKKQRSERQTLADALKFECTVYHRNSACSCLKFVREEAPGRQNWPSTYGLSH